MITVLLVDLGTPRDEVSEPLGIETLASYIEREFGNQVQVDLKSLELDNLASIAPYLGKFYSVIGLSTKIRAYARFTESIKAIQEKSPRSKIFVGDILGTYAFDEILKQYPGVICVRGEGEESFVEAIKALFFSEKPEQALRRVPNLAFVANDKMVIIERKPFDTLGAMFPKRTLAPISSVQAISGSHLRGTPWVGGGFLVGLDN
ncbi:cobalamin-dependent protein [Patescibacteria group bacterium]|nr:cobalamin-dependent protein [Patescibacteria group bacterium]